MLGFVWLKTSIQQVMFRAKAEDSSKRHLMDNNVKGATAVLIFLFALLSIFWDYCLPSMGVLDVRDPVGRRNIVYDLFLSLASRVPPGVLECFRGSKTK